MTITLPEIHRTGTLAYSVERLSVDISTGGTAPNAAVTYTPVTLSEETLVASYTDDGEIYTLEFELGKMPLPAGSYRVNLTWTYEDLCFAQEQVNFFINYTAYDAAVTQQEVPNRD